MAVGKTGSVDGGADEAGKSDVGGISPRTAKGQAIYNELIGIFDGEKVGGQQEPAVAAAGMYEQKGVVI